jgi:hypothetical protein
VVSDLENLWVRAELRVDDLWVVFEGALLDGQLEPTTTAWWRFALPELTPGGSYSYEVHFQVFGEERVVGPLSFTLSSTVSAQVPAPIVIDAVRRWTSEEAWGGTVPANTCGGASLESRLGERCLNILLDQGCWDVGPWLEFTVDLDIDRDIALYGISPADASRPWHIFPGDCSPETLLEDYSGDVCRTEQCFRVYAYDRRGLLAQEATVCEEGLDFGEGATADTGGAGPDGGMASDEADSGGDNDERGGCACRARGTGGPMAFCPALLALCVLRSRRLRRRGDQMAYFATQMSSPVSGEVMKPATTKQVAGPTATA